MSKTLKSIDDLADMFSDRVSTVFQLQRLEKLAHQNFFANLVYFQLICHLNYCIIQDKYAHNKAVIEIGTNKEEPVIEIAGFNFPLSFEGRRSAMAKAFEHSANKIDDMLSTTNLKNFTMSIAMVGDVVASALRGTRVQQTVTERTFEAGKLVKIIKKKA